MPRLTAVDAQTFWMSAKIPNDTVLLYGFAGVPDDLDHALEQVRERARGCSELSVRIDDPGGLAYPSWVECGVDPAQVEVCDLEDSTWAGCLSAVSLLVDDQLDARRAAWRLVVFVGVEGVPGVPTASGPGTVAVLQISHALGGGGRTSHSAAIMFGRNATMPEVTPFSTSMAAMPLLGFRAARAHRQLVADTEAGLVPPPARVCPVLRTNARPAGARGMATAVARRADLSGPTVTVSALVAISTALSAQLRDLGEDPSTLGAELMMAKALPRRAYNHFGTAGVGLYPDLTTGERGTRIAADIAARRQRGAHPAMRAADIAFAATPAPLLRWGTGQFNPDVQLAEVTGNTVVSSVNGGAADFGFGGVPVALIAAFPGLSPMMGLTHCVSGIGDTISVAVCAAESALGDFPAGLDSYVARLEQALGGT
ncbi:DUF1298 domain-containing protein [Mycolicibacterium sp. 624]|uniref:DUF1298 domain-containing protein n=1 Tax=Mycolicibacterium sp. 624 TaxID=3156314 RepID=UPI003399751F